MNSIRLATPLSEEAVRALKAGDRVLLSGMVVTARDRAHRYLVEEATAKDLPFNLAGGVIYHCGPITQKKADGAYELFAAGPTTSARMNPYLAGVLEKYTVRAVIGKGGMDAAALAAMKRFGAVYLHAVGGAAQVLASAVRKVHAGFKAEEFGAPEGLWLLEVEDFPAVVTMDTHGHSLHEDVAAASAKALKGLTARR
jgi:fumarate hydratase class I